MKKTVSGRHITSNYGNSSTRKPRKCFLSEFSPAILFCFYHVLLTGQGMNNAQLFRDSEPIRLLETPRSLSECRLIFVHITSFINTLKLGIFTHLHSVEHHKLLLIFVVIQISIPIISLPGAWLPFVTDGLSFY